MMFADFRCIKTQAKWLVYIDDISDRKNIYVKTYDARLDNRGIEFMSTEVKVEKIPWIPIAVLTFVLSIVGTIAVALNGSVGGAFMCSFNWGVYSRPVYIATFSIMLPMFVYPFRKRFKMSDTTLVSLYISGLVISYALGHYETFALIPTGFTTLLVYTQEPVKGLMQSWWWVPPYDAVEKMVAGGAATDWSLWFPSVAFWSSYFLVFFFFTSSVMLLFRRRWIDIEKVPFPHVVAAYETIRRVKVTSEPMGKGKYFLVGIAIGLVFEFYLMLTYLFPWWPDLLGWRVNTSATGCYQPAEGDPIGSQIVAWVGYSKDPLSFAMFYLAPLDVSFTVWITTLIVAVLSQVAYAMGYYTGSLSNPICCRMKGPEANSFMMGPPFYWGFVGTLGGVMGIAIMLLWNSRGYLAETISAARGSAKPEIESKEAFTYRTVYIMLAVSAILVLLFELSAGLSAGTALVILILPGFVFTISELYIMGLTGFNYINNRNTWRGWPLFLIWPTAPPEYTTDFLMSHTFVVPAMNHASSGMLITGMTAGQAFKMADLSGVSARSVYLLTVIGSIIAIPTVMATRIWVLNLLGTTRVPIWSGCSITEMCGNSMDWVYAGGRATFLVQAETIVVGSVITIILFLLRARFLWWPINPVGFIIATGYATWWMGSWDAFLGAWIAKYFTLRIGGSKAFEHYGLPVAGGLVAGITLGNFIAYIVGMVKFFVPF